MQQVSLKATIIVIMWCILLLAGLAAAAASDPYKEKRFEYIVKNQKLHLGYLEKKLHAIEEEFNELSADVDRKTIRHLKARISNLEGKSHQLLDQCISLPKWDLSWIIFQHGRTPIASE